MKLVAAALALCTGCAGAFTHWVPDDAHDRFDLDDARAPLIRLRRDGSLPATVSVAGDGVHVALDLAAACRAIPYARVVHEIREHLEMSDLGKVAIAIGLGGLLASFAGTQTVDGPYCERFSCHDGPHLEYTAGGATVALAGIALAAAPMLAVRSQHARSRVRDEADPAPSLPWPAAAEIGVPCGDDRAALRGIGALTATTPWGARLTVQPDAHGVAVFPFDREGDDIAFGTWRIDAPALNLALDTFVSDGAP
jgi:hypothetical protein|nr:hypothetical protein [Kofleriaceae bacterium]